uniref:Uncharacterized protein n=1 Tax=Parascaris univalens TaxID=6257 RepID=A0A915B0T3_PARUN
MRYFLNKAFFGCIGADAQEKSDFYRKVSFVIFYLCLEYSSIKYMTRSKTSFARSKGTVAEFAFDFLFCRQMRRYYDTFADKHY